MGGREVVAFLTWLAVERRVAASTQNQARAALLFLYSAVLDRPLDLGPIPRIPWDETTRGRSSCRPLKCVTFSIRLDTR